MVPSYEDDEEAWRILETVYPAIFENELNGWRTAEADWLQGRDFVMFKDWFGVAFHSIVEDLCEGEIVDDEDEA